PVLRALRGILDLNQKLLHAINDAKRAAENKPPGAPKSRPLVFGPELTGPWRSVEFAAEAAHDILLRCPDAGAVTRAHLDLLPAIREIAGATLVDEDRKHLPRLVALFEMLTDFEKSLDTVLVPTAPVHLLAAVCSAVCINAPTVDAAA